MIEFDAIFKLIKFLRQITKLLSQWRIQDFRDEEAPTAQGGGGGAPTMIWQNFCGKMNENEQFGGGVRVLLPPPPWSRHCLLNQ